jgi:ATP phosphoribosyltransferase
MRAAGLKAISTVVESTAVLIKNKNPLNPGLIKTIAGRIRGVIGKSAASPSGGLHLLMLMVQTHKGTCYVRTISRGML